MSYCFRDKRRFRSKNRIFFRLRVFREFRHACTKSYHECQAVQHDHQRTTLPDLSSLIADRCRKIFGYILCLSTSAPDSPAVPLSVSAGANDCKRPPGRHGDRGSNNRNESGLSISFAPLSSLGRSLSSLLATTLRGAAVTERVI